MSVEQFFNNRIITIPGVYTEFKSGVNNVIPAASFGDILLIDTGVAKMGGAGVNGELNASKDSIQVHTSPEAFKAWNPKGCFNQIIDEIFSPNGIGSNGASIVHSIKAATTTAPSISYTLENGSFSFKYLSEGVGSNGLATNKAASAIITISNAGAAGDTIKFVANSIDIGTIYTVKLNDTVNDVVKGLAEKIGNNSANYKIGKVTSSTIEIIAPDTLDAAVVNAHTSVLTTVGAVTGTVDATFGGAIDNYYLYQGYGTRLVRGSSSIGLPTYQLQFLQGNIYWIR